MASKDELRQDNDNMNSLKEQLSGVAYDLSQAAGNIDTFNSTLQKNYTIDENGNKSYYRANNLKNNITGDVNYINNVIIPGIDSRIQSNNAEIRRIEEEEERRRREEEERQRREAEEAARKASQITFNSGGIV